MIILFMQQATSSKRHGSTAVKPVCLWADIEGTDSA